MAQQGLVRYAMKSVAGDTKGPELDFGAWMPSVTSPGSGQALISWQTNYDRDSRNLTYKVYRNGVGHRHPGQGLEPLGPAVPQLPRHRADAGCDA